MKAIPFVALWLISVFNLQANEKVTIEFIEVESNESWEELFKKAKAEKKLIFVDAYTDWCAYCKKLDKEVYTSPEVIDYFEEHFINVKFDAETEFGLGKVRQFGIDGYPTLLFLTNDQTVYERIGGFVPIATLMAYAKDVAESWSSFPILNAQYKSGEISKEDKLKYIGILEKRDYEKAAAVASEYIASLSAADYLSIETLWLVSRFENQIGSAPYNYITNNKELIIKTHGRSEYEDYMKAVYNDNLELAIRYGELGRVNQLITDVIPEFIPEHKLPEIAYITNSIYYAQREEFDNYILTNNAYINNHLTKTDKRDWLIQESLEIINTFEVRQMYEHALDLLQQSISLDDENFQSQALAGYTCGLLNDFQNAERYLNQAEALAKGREEKEVISGLKQAVTQMGG